MGAIRQCRRCGDAGVSAGSGRAKQVHRLGAGRTARAGAGALRLDFKPGTSWKYTNSGYVLAGAIIQAVTHKPYGVVLRKLITKPLKLRHTGYSRTYPPRGYAKGYVKPGSPAPLLNGSELFSATGLYTTVDDIVRWDRAFGSYTVAPP